MGWKFFPQKVKNSNHP